MKRELKFRAVETRSEYSRFGEYDMPAFFIAWDGPGLGLACESMEDAERKAYMMNIAWNLAKGMTIDEIVKEEMAENELRRK